MSVSAAMPFVSRAASESAACEGSISAPSDGGAPMLEDRRYGARFAPAPLLVERAKSGVKFRPDARQ